MASGSLCIAHDGSCMADKLQTLCSAGVVIYCRMLCQWLKAAVADKSDSASNYRVKLLGVVMALLVLRVSGAGLLDADVTSLLRCDKGGIVVHGNRVHMSSTQKQVQADLIRPIRYLAATNPGRGSCSRPSGLGWHVTA